MSDTNRVSLRGAREQTWGEISPLNFQEIRYTGESLGYRIDTITSNEIRDDRQVTDLIQVGAKSDGGFNGELSFGAYDEYLLGALMDSGWHGVGGGENRILFAGASADSLDISLDATANTITLGTGHGVLNFVAGQTLRLVGSTSDDGEHTVSSVSGANNNVLTVSSIATTETLQSDAAVSANTTETITSGAVVSNLDFSLDATANTITLGSAVSHEIVSGQWIKLSGSTADDGFHKVTGVAGNTITVEDITTTEVLDETNAAQIIGAYIRNGTTRHSYSIEKVFNDVSPAALYSMMTGFTVSNMAINASAGEIFTINFEFLGKSALAMSTSSGTSKSVLAAASEAVMSPVADFGELREGGTALTGTFFQNIQMTLDNSLRGKPALGVLGNSDIGTGRFNPTGTITAYFESESLYNKYVNNIQSSVSFRLDKNSKAYVFDLLAMKFSDGNVVAGGADGDVMVELPFQGIRDTNTGATMQICRFI